MQFEASRLEGLEHRTDAQSAPEVFFTPIITPESLVAAYPVSYTHLTLPTILLV